MIQKLVLFACFICVMVSWSQEGKVQHKVFTQQDGLELDYIDTMAYDDDGFIWLGGSSLDMREIVNSNKIPSLQRFDGKSFHSIPLPMLSKPITNVRQLLKRSDGKFYVLGAKGSGNNFVLLFDPITTAFQEIDIAPNYDLPLKLSSIFEYQEKLYFIYQIAQTIYVATLSEETLQTKVLFSYTDTESLFTIDQFTVFIPFKDFCLIGDNHLPIHFFAWDGSLIKKEPNVRKVDSQNGESIRRYIDEFTKQDGVAYIMLYKNAQLHYINEETISLEPVGNTNIKLLSEQLKTVVDANGKSLWVACNKGNISFQKLYSRTGFNTFYKKELFTTSEAFTTLSQDLSKELWIARNKGELHYFQFASQTVHTFLPTHAIRAITALDTDEFMVATEQQGWYKVNPKAHTTKAFKISSRDTILIPNSSRAFFKDGNTLWSTSGSSIIEVDINTHKAQRYRHYPIISMIEATDSTFIYGTSRYALMEFNKKTKVHTPLLDTKAYRIFGLAIEDSLCVAATDKGFITYNIHTKEHQFYGSEALEDPYLLMATYHPVYGFLVGSRSGKVYSFNPETKVIESVYSDALEAGIATLLFKDDIWWINTFNGVVAFNPKDKSSSRYSEKDGFSHNEANRYSALDTGDAFLVGTIEGLNYFSTATLSKENPKWELTLMNASWYDAKSKSIKLTTNRAKLKGLKTIVLPQENKMLSLNFALTHNVGGREHSFRYRLNSEDWVAVKEQQSISFPILAAGAYTLEIEALDFSGKRIGKPLVYSIDSKDFFYNEWWFYLLLILMGLGIVFYLLKQASEKQKIQEAFSGALLVSQEKERTRIAKELHDSIGQQLTLIKRKAQSENKEEIASLSHKTLEEVRSISRGLYPAVLKQLGLSESIEQLILEIDEDTSLFCTAIIDDIDTYFSNEESLNFYRFIQESMNNCLKHSQATNLSVIVKDLPNKIILQIKDNGKGFNVAEAIKNNSLGLKTLKERVRILRGTIDIQSSVKGTNINCEIPKK